LIGSWFLMLVESVGHRPEGAKRKTGRQLGVVLIVV